MKRSTKLLLIGASFCAPGLARAAYYEEVTGTHLPPQLVGACMNAAAGDADGDGDLDLALAMEFEPKRLLLNDGAGRFSEASSQLPPAVHDSEDVAFADFDGDGDLDLVFVSEDDRTDEFYVNDGTGHYPDASNVLETDDITNDLVLMDLNGDALPDLLTGNISTERVLLSDGQGGFRDETESRWPQQGESRTQELEAADVDGDGDLDVVVANEGQNQLYLNEEGRLVDATATHLPVDTDETRAIRAADVDGDDDLDLLVGNVAFVSQESAQDYLLLNDGSGKFTRAAQDAFPEDARSNFMLQTADLDRDGDLDAIMPSTVFSNNGAEIMALARGANGARMVLRGRGMNMADADGDGDMDLELMDGERSVLLSNDGQGLIYPDDAGAWGNLVPAEDRDVNSDGQADLALMRIRSELFTVGITPDTVELQFIDIGKDGSIDVALPVAFALPDVGKHLVLLNDGSGRFTAASPGSVLPEGADGNGFDVEVAGFDGDGLHDLFLCNRSSLASAADQRKAGGVQRLLRGVEP